MKKIFTVFLFNVITTAYAQTVDCIRINQLGYAPSSIKVAVLGSAGDLAESTFNLRCQYRAVQIFLRILALIFGKYGPFAHTWRLDFSRSRQPGKYYLQCGSVVSPVFDVNGCI